MSWTFVHQEYPRCLHGAGGTTRIVQNDEERDRALAEGWSLQPVMAVADAPIVDAPPAATEAPVAEPTARRGRKAKA